MPRCYSYLALHFWLLLFTAATTVVGLSDLAARRTIVITGANRGVGFAAAQQLAANPTNQIVLACRDAGLGEAAARKIGGNNVEVQELDLADLKSIDAFAKRWGGRRLDVLGCNAGIQVGKGVGVGKTTGDEDALRTKQGYELTIGTNHIGHFVLVRKMLPIMQRTAVGGGRIVFTGSGVHNPDEPGGDVGSKATLGSMAGLAAGFRKPITMVDSVDASFDADKAYKDSKLCNVITAIELARRLRADPKSQSITVNVFNPGLIPTSGLFRDLNPIFVAVFTFITRYIARVAVTEEEGGRRLAYMVESLGENVTGGYFSGKPGFYAFSPTSPSKEAADEEVGKRLWQLTEQLLDGQT